MSGEVNRPGNYSISALSTLVQSLYVAGGISEIGSYRRIEVKRAAARVALFDSGDLLLNGDNTGDIRLRSGDVVFSASGGA